MSKSSAYLSLRFLAGAFVCFTLVSVVAGLRFDDLVARATGSAGSSGILFIVLLLRLTLGSDSASAIAVRPEARLPRVVTGCSSAAVVMLVWHTLQIKCLEPTHLVGLTFFEYC
ncbi:hypothetical protein DL98DRAFT_70971 [Cadophora sp. DSE1049]|nr:hypothetical protein DL98DRAFT_70971 [Cadophora sp. DSE1049]